jgi:hypothetical protein
MSGTIGNRYCVLSDDMVQCVAGLPVFWCPAVDHRDLQFVTVISLEYDDKLVTVPKRRLGMESNEASPGMPCPHLH